MRFRNYAERLAWRSNPGDGNAIVGAVGYCHEVLAVNPTAEEIGSLFRHGATPFMISESDAAEIDGKAWYSEDDSEEITPLPKSAKRMRK